MKQNLEKAMLITEKFDCRTGVFFFFAFLRRARKERKASAECERSPETHRKTAWSAGYGKVPIKRVGTEGNLRKEMRMI